jgi:hypothetical protein
MDVFVGVHMIGDGIIRTRQMATYPTNIRMTCSAIVQAAFCWNADNSLPKGPTLQSTTSLVQDFGTHAIIQIKTDEESWLYLMSVTADAMGASPWGKTVDLLILSHREFVDATTARLISAGLDLPSDINSILDWINNYYLTWEPQSLFEERSRAHYLRSRDPSVDTGVPDWLIANQLPNVANAQAFLDALPSEETAPLRLACTLDQVADSIAILRNFP